MSFLLLSILLAVGFIGIVFLVEWRGGASGVCLLAFVIMVLSFCVLPILSLQAFLTFIGAATCSLYGGKLRSVMTYTALAAVASFTIAYALARPMMQEFVELQEEYAFESMTGRLQYEVRDDVSETSEPSLGTEVENRLSSFEQDRNLFGWRSFMLRRLHRQTATEFALARGFGMSRMPSVSRGRVELPEVAPIPLPAPPPPGDDYDPMKQALPLAQAEAETKMISAPSSEHLVGLHAQGLIDFVDEQAMGYVASREEVAGFQPHQFRQMPRLDEQNEWQVTRLELISLLRHEKPVAYVSDHLPNMERLKGVPTRPLSGFEESALKSLRSDEDVVVDGGVNKIRMLGSLRASKDCLQCHSVRRGELLGAFSYDIMRTRPVPEAKRAETPPDVL